ncbi:MAG: redox-regulated ATPase YchF [Bdellovibrionales bacterium RBG_16_40_8]|nr:MAG: redox-regulated ATPase YchF [Bdellovibrionales bacterium RBG_16_40_8]
MGLKVGIVGLPNVGKSTLFNALTSAKAEAANYPFCTIDPNVGVVTVPDERLKKISDFVKPQKQVPTIMEFVDIAGLVAGASKGEGLGNQFLAHIRETDAILHVVRCFEDSNVVHVAGSVDPLRDIGTINTELILADLDSVDKRLKRIEKTAQTTKDAQLKIEYALVKKISTALNDGQPARSVTVDDPELPFMKELHLLTAKPVLYVCNVAEGEYTSGEPSAWVKTVTAHAKSENNQHIVICSAIEAEISQLPESDRNEFTQSLGMKEPGLNRLIREAYSLLNLITYFTAGEKEVRAWTIAKGTKAPQAAGVIHSDFERGFIRAETYHYNDLLQNKSEAAVKEAGKYRSEGKEYVVHDGDIMLFRFNV